MTCLQLVKLVKLVKHVLVKVMLTRGGSVLFIDLQRPTHDISTGAYLLKAKRQLRKLLNRLVKSCLSFTKEQLL